MRRKTGETRKHLRMKTIIIFLFSLTLVACNHQPSPKPTPTLIPTPTPSLTISIETPTPTETMSFNLDEKKEIFYYTVNPDTMETEAVSAMVNQEYKGTPDEIMSMVVDTLEESGYEIWVDQIFTEGTSIIVSFQAGEEPVIGLFEEEEKAILDAIAQSLLDNLEEYKQISYRIENEAYKSDNFTYQINSVYMIK